MRVCGLEGFTPATDDLAPSNNDEGVQEVNVDGAWSDLETQIRSVLAEVAGLEVHEVQKTNNIYHLGLDSFSAIKAVSLLRKQGVTYR